jgi:hypothetical protein
MPVNITPVDAWPTNLQVVQDGDNVSQAQRTVVMQDYADAATFLRNRVVGAGPGVVDIPVPLIPSPQGSTFDATKWSTGTTAPLEQDSVTNPGLLVVVELPWFRGAELVSVTLYYRGDGSHGAGVPANPVQLDVIDRTISATGGGVQVATTTDAPAFGTDIDAGRTVVATPASPVAFASDNNFAAQIVGENGANAFSGNQYYGLTMQVQSV